MLWHPRIHHDPTQRWFRGIVAAATAATEEEAPIS